MRFLTHAWRASSASAHATIVNSALTCFVVSWLWPQVCSKNVDQQTHLSEISAKVVPSLSWEECCFADLGNDDIFSMSVLASWKHHKMSCRACTHHWQWSLCLCCLLWMDFSWVHWHSWCDDVYDVRMLDACSAWADERSEPPQHNPLEWSGFFNWSAMNILRCGVINWGSGSSIG